MKISRNTVRNVIKKGEQATVERKSKHEQHLPVIKELYRECRGNAVRVQEELLARHDVSIPYQTLTWIIRKEGIGAKEKKRVGEYVFVPGEEMQHDTSPHIILLGKRKVKAQCASLVLFYSRKIFIQYYPCFTRFECKVFLADAFTFMDGTASRCIVDNTNVVIANGVGPDAVIAPEMEHFGKMYGTRFEAHCLGDSDRKGRVERPFHYVENNFIPGRTFLDWQDVNRQAADWCRNISNPKYKRSLGMSPDAAYILEKPHLNPLPPVTPPVYTSCYRVVDTQGYIHLETNRYSVPQRLIGEKLEVQKHRDKVLIYNKHEKITEHKRILGKRDSRSTLPNHHPPMSKKRRNKGISKEELLLTGKNDDLDLYIKNLKEKSHGRGIMNLRRLLNLQRTYPPEPFTKGIRKALRYGLYDLARVETMILDNVAGDFFDLS